jgi:hypothetical protein
MSAPMAGYLELTDGFSLNFETGFYPTLFARSTTKLSLACPLQAPGPDNALQIKISPPEDQPWPLKFDHTKTSAEISALKTWPGGLNFGLTIAKAGPQISITWQETSSGTLGGGSCPYVESIDIDFQDIRMYVSKKYSVGSCEYRETRQHEEKHYKAYVDTLRLYQPYFKQALKQVNIPTRARPVFVGNFDAGTDNITAAIKGHLKNIVDTLADQMNQERIEVDEETEAVLARCRNW